MLNPRRVMTRAQLLDHVWNYDFGGDGRVLETYISYLRKKLDAARPVADQDRARRRLRAAGATHADVLAARPRAGERAGAGGGGTGRARGGHLHRAALLPATGVSTRSVRGAGPALSQALDSAGYRPPTSADAPALEGFRRSDGRTRPRRRTDGGGRPSLNLPPGTYGQRRDATGKVLGHVLITYGQSAARRAQAPGPASRSASSSRSARSAPPGCRYRVYAQPRPRGQRRSRSSPFRMQRSRIRRSTACCSSRRS